MSSPLDPLGRDGTPSAFLIADPVLAPLIERLGPAPIGARPPFIALVRAVISQQISTKAAQAIAGRLEARLGFEPEPLASARLDALRRVGLSRSKARYVRNIARFALNGGFEGLNTVPDDDVVSRLTAIPGVGAWTAQMVMIFALGRPDVWPVGDAGIQRAARLMYRVRTARQLEKLGERFCPWRSHAAWYLWRALEQAVNQSVRRSSGLAGGRSGGR